MKKKIFLICMVTIIAIIGLIYAGCSKSADMQTTPGDNNSNYALNSCKSSEEPFVVPIIIRKEYYDEYFCENFEKLPSEMYFINSILAGYKSREIWFNDERKGKKFINNLEAISTSYTLSKKKNYNGMIHKLQELENKVPSTLIKVDADVIKAIIELTAGILEEASNNLFIVPDYLDGWDDVVSFFYSAKTQSIVITIVIIIIAISVGLGVAIYLKGRKNIGGGYDGCMYDVREAFRSCRIDAYNAYESSGDGGVWETAKGKCMDTYKFDTGECGSFAY